jgi:hypothetical protein
MAQKIFSLCITTWFVLTLSTCSFGAIQPVSSPFNLGNSWYSKTDTWYSVGQDSPEVNVYARNISPDFSLAGGEYYKSDQTFADLYFQNVRESRLVYFGGSYLFDSGFFMGLNYVNVEPTTETVLSPGYRFKVRNHGYVAVSFDYQADDYSNTHSVVDFDVDFKLFPKNMKIYGGISLPTNENDTVVNLNANYKVNQKLVAGANFMSHGGAKAYSAGFTYRVKSFIIDTTLGKNFTENYYQLAAMNNLKNFSIGALLQKYQNDSDPGLTVQGKYHLKNADFILKHTLQNDSYAQATVLVYERKL